MNGILPDEILGNNRRGLQSADWFEKMLGAHDEIRSEMTLLKKSDMACKVLDMERMERLVDEMPKAALNAEKAMVNYRYVLESGLMTGRFLRWVESGAIGIGVTMEIRTAVNDTLTILRRQLHTQHTFWNKSAIEERLLVEAAFSLLIARLAIALLPFRCLDGSLNCPSKKPGISGAKRDRLRNEISWAVGAAAKHLPVKTVWFLRGLAAQMMLRRRGICSTLYYGVANLPERGLVAHVWVKDGSHGVVGHGVAGQYTELIRYPEKG